VKVERKKGKGKLLEIQQKNYKKLK